MPTDVIANINYLDRQKRYLSEKPFSWSSELACLPDLPSSNHVTVPHPVKIHDLRGSSPAHLDTHGFTVVQAKTSLRPEDMSNEALIEATYYSEIEDLLWREIPGLTGIAIFGHQVLAIFQLPSFVSLSSPLTSN